MNIVNKYKQINLNLFFMVILLIINSFAHAKNINKTIGEGAYEMAYSIKDNALFLATAQNFKLDKGGIIYKLNPDNLNITQIIHNDLKPFGMTIDNISNILYLSNTINGSITVIDAHTGNTIKHIILDNKKFDNQSKPLKPRELVLDTINNHLYVTGVGARSVIWVIDSKTLKLITTINNTGKKATGLALNKKINELYVTNSEGEILTINTNNNKIEQRKIIDKNKEHIFLNISLDLLGQRIFLSDIKQSQILVLDTKHKNIIHKINIPQSLGIIFNPKHNEIYATHREANIISIIDAKNNYNIKKIIKVKGFPNSLELSPNGDILYVSIKRKQKIYKNKTKNLFDNVLRIDLLN